MKIAISGASGFVGSHLSRTFSNKGAEIIPLTRQDFPKGKEHLQSRLEGCTAVFNLAGETISRRWTEPYMQAIYDSRIKTTGLLVDAMTEMEQPPATFISTSAMGAFDAARQYTEDDPPNATDFLGKVAKDWEAEAQRTNDTAIRTLIFRFGLVLGPDGGLIKQVLPPFKMGMGGTIGDGSQPFSWIHIQDLVRAYQHALEHPEMEGTYHLTAPGPVTNLIFTKTLGQLLHRPTMLPLPLPFLKLMFGRGAEAISAGQTLISKRLPEAGFHFEFETIEDALRDILASR